MKCWQLMNRKKELWKKWACDMTDPTTDTEYQTPLSPTGWPLGLGLVGHGPVTSAGDFCSSIYAQREIVGKLLNIIYRTNPKNLYTNTIVFIETHFKPYVIGKKSSILLMHC